MTDEKTIITPFLSAFMTILFMFSTIFGLAFLYFEAANKSFDDQGIPQANKNMNDLPVGGGIGAIFNIIGVLNTVLNIVSWISPFALVRGLLLFLMPTDLYTVFDLFVLRPVSWIVTIFTAGYIKSWIPTESGEL